MSSSYDAQEQRKCVQHEHHQQQWPLGTTIYKDFDGVWYMGKVERFDTDTGYYHIRYEDNDEEDLDDKEMQEWTLAMARHLTEQEKGEATSSRRPRRSQKRISYVEVSLFESSEEEDEPAPRQPGGNKNKRQKKRKDDGDESFASDMEEDEEELLLDEAEESDDSDNDNRTAKSTRQRHAKQKPKSTTKSGKSMAESFKPMDTPCYYALSQKQVAEEHSYLDPCGMEATDDIIDRLVGEQVSKIGALLTRALGNENALGGTANPLMLGTACSGTDAPSLALTIVQEQMERLQMTAKLNYQHKFSCEKEPFKQSYLARNFDSVLYPDIVKLTDDEPRDVYGRQTKIPTTNVFVAGTSCKNFSLLHSTKRLDIEDKGCSGETFLAAVELLFKEQPEFAIFENVIDAPWAKMQEYIRGRVLLATVYDKAKAIKKFVAKEAKIKDLTFKIQSDGCIFVTEVPLQVGVRCGAVVRGFSTRQGLLRPKWPGTSKSCTLPELLKANKSVNPKKDTLVFETPCTYCTCIQKVDTKMYGLPQTRQRTYMFVWKPDDPASYDDDLGEYWKALVKHLESPVKHSLEAFILNVDHDNIRVFREALNGPPGRHTKRSVFQEEDFWQATANANLKHNKIARDKLGMDDMARDNTSWGERGKKQVPPHYWLEFVDCQRQREIDMLDILHASAARDAETHDSNFSSFFWNISQNVSKEKHRTKVPGIAGCISPGGEFFVSNLGRPLLGCEKLLLQGIPYFRLALGSETEVELGDMAGNAMSLTCVCATLLAAIGCRQLKTEYTAPRSDGIEQKDLLDILQSSGALPQASEAVTIPDTVPDFGDVCSSDAVFLRMAKLAQEAVQSSVWCTCETSGRNSASDRFWECSICRVSCCSSCVHTHNGYQLGSHDVHETVLTAQKHHMGRFLTRIRDVAPASLTFDQEGISFLADLNEDAHRVKDLHKFQFNLHKVQRERRKWMLYYVARDSHGVGEVVAEFRITIGELRTETSKNNLSELGMKGELTSFFPAKLPPLVPGPLEPCAVVTVRAFVDTGPEWLAKDKAEPIIVDIRGRTPESSFRVQVGLTDKAAASLRQASRGPQKKHFAAAQARGEERRWLYVSNWKEWPRSIEIKSFDHCRINGTYERAACRHTINQSALWVRQNPTEPLYLIIKPNVGRTGPDVAVISRSVAFADVSDVEVILNSKWQPCDALVDGSSQQRAERCIWVAAKEMHCSVPRSKIEVRTEGFPSTLSLHGLSEAQVNMLYPFQSAQEDIILNLNVHHGVEAQKIKRAFNYLCVPPLLSHIASTKISDELSSSADWKELSPIPGQEKFGFSEQVIPRRPVEQWRYDDERDVWTRMSSPEESRQYYLRLQEARKAFEFMLDKGTGSLHIKCNPDVPAHHAARFLVGGRGLKASDEIKISFRMSDVSMQADPVISPFKVFPCGHERPTDVALKGSFKLYERQQKVVTKMTMIESGAVAFEELEMAEQEMPGSTGYSIIAKATRSRPICGGVIADAIGAGKTVISIALILQGLKEARASRSFPQKSGATLVVVPSGLVDQWSREIDKFATGVNVICIYGTAQLEEISVQQMIEADVIICIIDIIESPGYTANLAKMSGLCEADVVESKGSGSSSKAFAIPCLPQKASHAERLGAKGVWIPASSRDPYGTGQSSSEVKFQKLREDSAFFTHAYLTSIQKLRQKHFSKTDKGVPLEYFSWERVVVDEIHECLCTEKDNLQLDYFKEKNRRASRELLGISQRNMAERPLLYRRSIFGLTGTPMLENSDRVIELASLIGCTYIIGLASHWRKLERESSRDIFLQHFLEPKSSREIRKAIYTKCQDYLKVACCRNTTEKELEGIEKKEVTVTVHMTETEKEDYMESQHGIDRAQRGLHIGPGDFDPSAGHDVSKFLTQNSDLPSRGKALVNTCRAILSENPGTKIIVFADGSIGSGGHARKYLMESGLGCSYLETGPNADVERINQTIFFYQRPDVTEEDRHRPRVLVLHFAHAAGLNLQEECSNLILYTPLYVGEGGSSGNPVDDASTEQQAIGRVFRPGQKRKQVNVYRIEVQGPNGEECLDGMLIRRNTDEKTLVETTNAAAEEED